MALPMNYAKIINEDCSKETKKKIVTSDLEILTANTKRKKETIPQIHVNIGPDSIEYFDFIREGWKSQRGDEKHIKEHLHARQVKLIPLNATDENGKWFSIDSEEYEAKSVQVTLFPNVIRMFCKQEVPAA